MLVAEEWKEEEFKGIVKPEIKTVLTLRPSKRSMSLFLHLNSFGEM